MTAAEQHPSRRPARLATFGAVLVLLPMVLSGCLGPESGDSLAAARAESLMLEIADALTPTWGSPRDGDFLAVRAVELNPRRGDDTQVEALSWSGNSAVGAGGAVIELRIFVKVDAFYPNSLGLGRGNTEGSSARCWELRVFARNYDEYELREFTCPDTAAPPLPTPTPLPTMPADVEARLTTALAGATQDDLLARLQAGFAGERVTIDAVADSGELIAAIGERESGDCVVAVRHADGTLELLRGWPSEWLLPGETGCAVGLYLNPPR